MTLPMDLMFNLFKTFAPVVRDIIATHAAAHNGALPTDAEMLAIFNSNIDKYLSEGAAWRATHPKKPVM